jgi:hypothetical protein
VEREIDADLHGAAQVEYHDVLQVGIACQRGNVGAATLAYPIDATSDCLRSGRR